MIGKETRLFGLIAPDEKARPIAHLYNYLFGYNGEDAAYMLLMVHEEDLSFTLTNLAKGKLEEMEMDPTYRQKAAVLLGAPHSVDSVRVASLGPQVHLDEGLKALDALGVSLLPERFELFLDRAPRSFARWFGYAPRIPEDWRAAAFEETMRPCKLTDDHFKEYYGNDQRA